MEVNLDKYITLDIKIKEEAVRDLLINGFETTQWFLINEDQDFTTWFDEDGMLHGRNMYEDDRPAVRLTRKKVFEGLKLMHDKSPHHFADFVNENWDAITSDVLIQYAVFGEIIYG